MPSGNNNNLIPLNERDPEDALRIRRMGQAAGVKERLRKKTLKEQLLLMLDDDKIQALITTCLIERAKQMDNVGNKAYEIIRDTAGEKPTDKSEVKTELNISEEDKKLLNNLTERLK